MQNILEIRDLGKNYGNGEVDALKCINFDIAKGELISIIGPSGAGKSTFLRCINRMIDPTSGEIIFEGNDVASMKKKKLKGVRSSIGMIFQHYNVVNQLTALENVLHGKLGKMSNLKGVLGLYTEEDKQKALDLLDELGLKGHEYKKCKNLSGGQKQRVGIARALMQEPKLILCDEPIASLDPQSSKVIMEILKDISTKKNITCLVNLHQVEVALSYSDRIIGLRRGELIYAGPADQVTDEVIYDIYGAKEGELI